MSVKCGPEYSNNHIKYWSGPDGSKRDTLLPLKLKKE